MREGDLLFLSGQGPREVDGHLHSGKVGAEVSVKAAYGHARLTGINLIAVMQTALGDLQRVKRIVKLFGMVNGTADFADHPSVIYGRSDLFIEVFGERDNHARSAVGMASLPGNSPSRSRRSSRSRTDVALRSGGRRRFASDCGLPIVPARRDLNSLETRKPRWPAA